MKMFNLIITTEFGLESIVKREALNLGLKDINTSNGKVEFVGGPYEIALANINIRCGERVLLKLDEFKALEFEDIYQNVYNSKILDTLPKDRKIIVNAKSKKSKITSLPAIQSVGKKAIIDRLKEKFSIDWFKEDGLDYNFELDINKDICTFTLDTTGDGLHKRGYREIASKAPLRETIASAMVNLSFWNKDRPLVDLFCGSGTILIEAAMIGRNIPSGMMRSFTSEKWDFIGHDIYQKVRDQAIEKIDYDSKLDLRGFDIDPNVIKVAKDNAAKFGLSSDIDFKNMDMRDRLLEDNYGVLISNPPYGMRISDKKNVDKLEIDLGKKMKRLPTWSSYILTASEDFEKKFGKKASKKRKIYNGRIKTDYYQFYGPNPYRK